MPNNSAQTAPAASDKGPAKKGPGSKRPAPEFAPITAWIEDRETGTAQEVKLSPRRVRAKNLGAFVRVSLSVFQMMAEGHEVEQPDGTTRREFLTAREMRVLAYCIAALDYDGKPRPGVGDLGQGQSVPGAPAYCRADLARALDLAPAAVSAAVARLIDLGYLYEVSADGARRKELMLSPFRFSRARDTETGRQQEALTEARRVVTPPRPPAKLRTHRPAKRLRLV